MRAVGSGLRVLIAEFIKGKWRPGEYKAAARLAPELTIVPMGKGFLFTAEAKHDPANIQLVRNGWEFARSRALSGEYDLVVFDEINYVISYGMLPVEDVLDFLNRKPPALHVILTGRNAHPAIVDQADLVTEMKLVKHPFERGIMAQRGIEY